MQHYCCNIGAHHLFGVVAGDIFINMVGEDEEEIEKEETTKIKKEELETEEEIKTKDEKEEPKT